MDNLMKQSDILSQLLEINEIENFILERKNKLQERLNELKNERQVNNNKS